MPQISPNPADIKYYITDHLNSTAMFVDQAGTTAAILDDNDMYPWGGVVPGVGKTTSNNAIKFTGQYRDTDTAANLDYFGARYYSSTIGRFMTPDWAGAPTTVPYAKFGGPQSLNLYSYTENGPINRIDADGHSFAGFDGFMRPEGGDAVAYDFESHDGHSPDFLRPRTGDGLAIAAAAIVRAGKALGSVGRAMSAVSSARYFEYGINRWMYRMDQKIDGVVAPWVKALENVIASLSPPSEMVTCVHGICYSVPVKVGIVFPVGGMGTVEAEASSAASGLRLSKQIASEAQMSEAGVPMAGAGTEHSD